MSSRAFSRWAPGLFVVLWCGCSSFTTSNRPLANARVTGQLYYLPQGKVRLSGEWKYPGSRSYSSFIVSVGEEIEADPGARYYLKPDANLFYDDDTQLSVNAKGLLTTADATSEDRVQGILASASSVGADALQFAVGVGADVGGANAQAAVAETPPQFKPFSLVFDPADRAEKQRITARILRCGFRLQVIEEEPRGAPLREGKWTPNATTLTHGVIFRPLKPWRIILDSSDDSVVAVRETKLLHLPDKAHPLVLDYSRVPFVKAVKNVTFVDGTPRDYSRKVPSPVFGFLGIPKALIGAVAPLPLQLKQTQISNLRADETLRKLRPAPAAEP